MLGSLFSGDSPIDGYLLVYDITSRTSLENLVYFDELIEKNVESGLRPPDLPQPVKIVAGNKCDLSNSRVVSSSEGLAWAKAHGCGFMETSAKVMVNIEETFETMIRQVVQSRQTALDISNGVSHGPLSGSNTNSKSATIRAALSSHNLRQQEKTTAPNETKKRSGCCVVS